jgi:hypothetical protein
MDGTSLSFSPRSNMRVIKRLQFHWSKAGDSAAGFELVAYRPGDLFEVK